MNLRKRRGIVRLEAARCPDNDDDNQNGNVKHKKVELINIGSNIFFFSIFPFFTTLMWMLNEQVADWLVTGLLALDMVSMME